MNNSLFTNTDRLILRRPVSTDAEVIYSAYAGKSEVTRYVGWPRHQSVDDSLDFIKFSDHEWRSNRMGPLLCFDKASERLVGSTGLSLIDERTASTGYVIAPDFSRQGLATECLRAMMDLSQTMRLLKLVAYVHPEHQPSARVLVKCGFVVNSKRNEKICFPNLEKKPLIEAICYEFHTGQY